jgi:hypothetical protein
VIPFGGGILEHHTTPGWTVQLGARRHCPWPGRFATVYSEFGGGYTSVGGDASTVTTGGDILVLTAAGQLDRIIHLEDFANTRLNQLKFYTFHAALGGYSYPAWLNYRGGQNVQLNLRAGIRTGAVNGRWLSIPTPSLLMALAGLEGQPIQLESDVREPGFLLGLFASTGVGVDLSNLRPRSCRVGVLTFRAEVEFGHDWFGLGDFSKGDPGLATVSPMLSLTFTY